MLQCTCPKCRTVLQVNDTAKGAIVQCPKCQQRIQIVSPAPSNVETPLSPPQLQFPPVAQLVSALATQVATEQVSVPLATPYQVNEALPDTDHRDRVLGLGVAAGVFGVFSLILLALGVVYVGTCLLLAVVAVGVYLGHDCCRGEKTACPTCKRWWAKVKVDTVMLEKKKCYGLVTRSGLVTSRSHYSGSGYSAGGAYSGSQGGTVSSDSYSTWEERVPVIRTTYELHFQCRFCGEHWTKRKVNEVEDFDIERP